MEVKNRLAQFRQDYVFRSFVTSGLSALATAAFFLYNLALGLIYHLIWNFSISIYYLLLMVLRGTIVLCERRWQHRDRTQRLALRRALFRWTCRILLLVDLALAVPIALMVLSRRPVTMGMIPTITVAAYTTYKVVFGVWNYRRTRRSSDLSLHGLKVINLMDAILSVLTLQNTMVMVFGRGPSMQTLTAYTSGGLLGLMVLLTLLALRRSRAYCAK